MQNGDILKELRDREGYNQQDVADILKTSRQYYSKYENEKFELPLHHLETLADHYGVSTDYILGRTRISDPYPKR